MKAHLLIPAAAIALTPTHAFSDTFNEKCSSLASCAQATGKLLGQNYLFDPQLKGTIKVSPNITLTRENAELLFTSLLQANNLSRIPVNDQGLYMIASQRDARDAAIPLVLSSAERPPELPLNHDLITLRYEAKNPGLVDHFARTSRSFMPANSRIIPDQASGSLLITDTALNLRKLYPIIRTQDVNSDPKRIEEKQPET